MNWFKHDYSAAEDDKILELRAIYGWQGYGVFFAILEYMCKTEKGIDRKRIGSLRMVLGTVEGYLEGYLEDTLNIGLFYEEDGIIWNQRIRDHIESIQHRREEGSKAGKKSAEKRREKQENEGQSKVTFNQPSRLPSRLPSTDKIRVDKIREDKILNERVYERPRTKDDNKLIDFFKNNGSTPEEAARFFSYYNSQGWLKNNNMPISDWESLAYSWIQRALHDPRYKPKAEKQFIMTPNLDHLLNEED